MDNCRQRMIKRRAYLIGTVSGDDDNGFERSVDGLLGDVFYQRSTVPLDQLFGPSHTFGFARGQYDSSDTCSPQVVNTSRIGSSARSEATITRS